jgi:hypothetical protein
VATARDLAEKHGHPGTKYDALIQHITDTGVKRFADIEDAWLDLMWTLDQYRIAGVVPEGMEEGRGDPARRLAAVYRGKGNWFAKVLASLLENQTVKRIAPIIKVRGFSQVHQVDVAWPARHEDPLICAESKVTGAPGYGSTPERGALADWVSRRKELKFAATDLKLFRRDQATEIDHWGVWREAAPPKTYFLWAARLRRGRERTFKTRPPKIVARDSVEQLVREAHALVDTYLDGAGVVAWQINDGGDGYEAVPVADSARVSSLDDVLHRMASEIKQATKHQAEPPPVVPTSRAVDERLLLDDERSD